MGLDFSKIRLGESYGLISVASNIFMSSIPRILSTPEAAASLPEML